MPQEAFFFRESKGALYGSYHPPTAAVKPTAVVLCPPYGHEYVQSHRAFRLLADRLAEAGFPALRFDYRGTGDSAGDAAEQADLSLWREDLRAATEMCRARSGRQRVCALGLRLGGSLAALEAARSGAFDALVLWDPIVSGPDYLRELTLVEQDFRMSLPGSSLHLSGQPDDVLGFPYPTTLQEQLQALDLAAARVDGTRSALVIHTQREQAGSAPSLALGVAQQEAVTVSDPRIWMEDAEKALIPQGAIGAAVDWLSKLYA